MRILSPLALTLLACAGGAPGPPPEPEHPSVPDGSTCATALLPSPTALPFFELADDVDFASPGAVRILRVCDRDRGDCGHAAVIRLASRATDASIYRGERREWALVARLEPGDSVQGHSYLSPDHPPTGWVYRPAERRVERIALPAPEDDLDAWALRVLDASRIASQIEVVETCDGRVVSRSRLARLLHHPLQRGDP